MLSFHDGNQILGDVIQLVTGEQVGDFAARQDVVHVFCGGEERWVETGHTAAEEGSRFQEADPADPDNLHASFIIRTNSLNI